MDTKIIPLVKNKCGKLSDKNNYRPVAISNSLSKVFELILLDVKSICGHQETSLVSKRTTLQRCVSMHYMNLLIIIAAGLPMST